MGHEDPVFGLECVRNYRAVCDQARVMWPCFFSLFCHLQAEAKTQKDEAKIEVN